MFTNQFQPSYPGTIPEVEYTDELKILRPTFSTHAFFQTILWLFIAGLGVAACLYGTNGLKEKLFVVLVILLYTLIAASASLTSKPSYIVGVYFIYIVANALILMTSIGFIYEYATKSKQTFISKSGPETFTIIFILCLYMLYSEILCLETLLETCRAIRKHDLKYKRNIENIFENLTKAMDSSQIV
uniref:Uncharacterized protein n=1 Tax=Acrobeloides nanus TaxID=290746 RepID=A0A914DQ48_9BILA